MSSVRLLTILYVAFLWTYSSCIKLNVKEPYNRNNPIQQYTIEAKGRYELIAAGAAGGGDINAPGGRGGIAAVALDFEKNDVISISIGAVGENSGKNCGGAGGGGATIVYKPPTKQTVDNELLLVGPGGGGSGMNQKPIDPDWLELNTPVFGSCDPCVLENRTCDAAAAGKDIYDFLRNEPLNFTYNPSNSYNYTRGCVGGYGGGGQGGPLRDRTNKTTSGGGGGGGGYPGGSVGEVGNAKSCSAGGPGKAYCKKGFCNVTRLNEEDDGYFMIRLHEPYRELPNRDRTNNEKPYAVQADGSRGSEMTINGFLLVLSVVSYKLLSQG